MALQAWCSFPVDCTSEVVRVRPGRAQPRKLAGCQAPGAQGMLAIKPSVFPTTCPFWPAPPPNPRSSGAFPGVQAGTTAPGPHPCSLTCHRRALRLVWAEPVRGAAPPEMALVPLPLGWSEAGCAASGVCWSVYPLFPHPSGCICPLSGSVGGTGPVPVLETRPV